MAAVRLFWGHNYFNLSLSQKRPQRNSQVKSLYGEEALSSEKE